MSNDNTDAVENLRQLLQPQVARGVASSAGKAFQVGVKFFKLYFCNLFL